MRGRASGFEKLHPAKKSVFGAADRGESRDGGTRSVLGKAPATLSLSAISMHSPVAVSVTLAENAEGPQEKQKRLRLAAAIVPGPIPPQVPVPVKHSFIEQCKVRRASETFTGAEGAKQAT
jgi:hypothetical protein